MGVLANLKQISTGKEHFPSRVFEVAVNRRGMIVSATKGFYGCVVDMTIVKSDSAMLAMKDGVYSEYEYLLYDAEGKTNFVKSDIISAGSRKKRQRVYGSSIVDVCLATIDSAPLSILDITKSKLEEMINQTISAPFLRMVHFCYNAKHHATIYGAGQPSETILHRGNIAKKQNIVDRFVAYCLAKGVMTTNGRTLAIPGKDSISLPIVKRLEGKQPLMKSFEDDERSIRGISDEGRGRNQRREYVSLRRQAIGDIIAVVCPEIHTSKAALDVVGQLYGTTNFNLLRTKLVQLDAMLPTLNDEILMLKVSMSAAEEALSHKDKFRSKKDFGSAVDIHGPAVHCHYFTLFILLTFIFMIR